MSKLKVNKIGPLSGNSFTILDDDGSSSRITIDTSGNVGIGQSSPSAKLEIEVGSADGVTGLLIDADDADQIALQIESDQTTVDVIDITADSLTTGYVIDISADALTSGRILNLDSDSSSTSTRYLVHLANNNTAAVNTIPLIIRQDAVEIAARIWTSQSSFTEPLLEVKNLGSDAQGPILRLTKNGSSAAAADECGEISFYGEDSAGNATEFGNIQCIQIDETAGSEEGALVFSVAEYDGTLTEGMRILGHSAGARTQVLIGRSTSSFSTLFDCYANLSGYAGSFYNDGDSSDRKGIYIVCGPDTPASQGDCVYIGFADGNSTAAGGIQCGSTVANPEFFNGSDARIKNNIAPTKVIGLDVINGLEMKEFRWDPDFCSYSGLNRIGFIAQNCENVYPEMVSEHDHNLYDFDIKTVAKGELIPVLVKAIQELSNKIDYIESQLS